MRLLLFFLLLFPATLTAQKKLPLTCTELKSKLVQIKKSYKLFDKWKKQQIGKDDEGKWTSDFTLCGAKGIIDVDGDNDISLVFDFSGYDDNEKDCEAFIKKLSKAITEVFDHLVYEEEKDEGDDMMPETQYYRWRDNRLFVEQMEEVEIEYPALDSPLKLRFRRWKF